MTIIGWQMPEDSPGTSLTRATIAPKDAQTTRKRRVIQNDTTYSGLFSEDLFGIGTISWADGQLYKGEVALGQPSGQGSMTFADGRTYTGAFYYGKTHGIGELHFPDGSYYSGEFDQGQFFFDYSDKIFVYLNGKLVFSGNNAFRSKGVQYQGHVDINANSFRHLLLDLPRPLPVDFENYVFTATEQFFDRVPCRAIIIIENFCMFEKLIFAHHLLEFLR